MIDNNILVFIENTRRIKEVIIARNPSRTTNPMIAVWSIIGSSSRGHTTILHGMIYEIDTLEYTLATLAAISTNKSRSAGPINFSEGD